MSPRTVTAGIFVLFVVVLGLASVAPARVGGGASSGSRGSRSFSAPRSPSVPSSPSTTPSLPGPTPAPTPPSRPGFGWGGMLGGFLLGGLLGGLLFGGGAQGFGGIGLLDIVLLGGFAALALIFFWRRQQRSLAYAGGPGGGEWTPAEPALAGPALGRVGAPDRDLEDLGRGLGGIRMMDPGFTPVRFATAARDLFVRVQAAWSTRALGPLRPELTDELAASLETDLERLRAQHRTNRLEQLQVESADPTEAWQELGQDFVTIRFRARAVDYTVDDATGAVVEGSATAPTSFEEFWTFTRPVGPNAWRLSAIQQPGT
jgi:predicted lipid-binding transport protein (Tim44 family)